MRESVLAPANRTAARMIHRRDAPHADDGLNFGAISSANAQRTRFCISAKSSLEIQQGNLSPRYLARSRGLKKNQIKNKSQNRKRCPRMLQKKKNKPQNSEKTRKMIQKNSKNQKLETVTIIA
jgi:hypothetical protein